ncbi:polysaccharide deacetylase 2 family uncharacterized protein YibQ [Methylopila capsulata]|uniref:Polysaccharide deacetylase 2 family uncharacterized protein YibQ n=1 Tax=Methylopila capsulata TaxID=61654 RepID=A0A9W6IRW2_9HYPH|nr:divergent polysaccharide deacetylase family protein [Methylopila capsulata]MBM7851177.1 polysaccharide deacetylase 2 family uncharacterized protein YibQ [Methylopila capsulata]GLK54234.1 hypothetical protein GCM10008170_02530 [Methylopila capsulata]
MTHDDLEKPVEGRLAKTRAAAARRRPRVDPALVVAVAAVAVLAFGGVWAMVVTDPLGGQPVMTAAIERRGAPAPEAAAAPETHAEAKPEAAARDGVPIVRPGDPMPKSGPVIIRVPGAEDARPARGGAPAAPGEIDKALLEDSRYGGLPRVAADGRRPLDAYARGAETATGARVALVVGGLGVGREATLQALAALPAEVSVAFSPYGSDVADLVAKARGGGREVLLQAPMEPFDYPANDPGPQTLLTNLPASANLERLRWSLGRAEGYVGLAPLAGARFLETEPALQPIFVELARRGLMFIGGAPNRADKASPIASQAGLPFARPAVVVDAASDAEGVDVALARLEREARSGTVAVGWATLSPLLLKRVDIWRAGLAERGVALVPVSAAGGAQTRS